MSGFSSWARAGSLSPRSFIVDGSAVRVLVLVEHAGGVFLATDQAMGTDFVLDVGGLEFVGSHSLVPALAVRGAYWWPSGGLSWSDGDEVDVELRVAADAVPIGVRGAAPLWAYFDRVPDTHDGTDAFGVRLRFGEDVDTDAATLRDGVIVAAGGTITAVEPATGSTRNWTVTVVPDGAGDVIVFVGSGLWCADAAAVCTADGRTLAADISVSIAGPAASVSLSSLTLDGALLDPAFDPEVTLYTAQADAGISQVTVAGMARDSAALVDVLPADADPNTAGHQVTVAEGAQTAVAVTVTAADGDISRHYWVVLDGPPVSGGTDVQEVPGLTGLALDGLASLGFTPAQHRYEAVKAAGVTMVTVIASSDDSDATVEVLAVRSDDSPLVIDTDDADPDTAGHQVALSEAGETLMLVLVTSADAKRQDVYVVLVRQPAAQPPAAPGAPVTKNTVAPGLLRGLADGGAPGAVLRDTAVPTLSALSLDGIALTPQFAAATTSYTATVETDVAQVTVTATPAGDASVMYTPADADTNTAGWQVALPAADPGGAPSQTNIAAIVTSSDGMTANAYLITVSRQAPAADDAALATLALDGVALSPAFDPATRIYTAEVGTGVDQVTLDLSTTAGATVTVVPTDDDPNTAGWQIPLTNVQAGGQPSTTVVAIVVTAADTNTRQTYTVTVTRRAPPPPAPLSGTLPEPCALLGLNADGHGTFTGAGSWHPRCQSLLEYFVYLADDTRSNGNARFFYLGVHEQSDVTIRLESNTSRHIVLRSADGTEIEHVFYHIERSSGVCSVSTCSPAPVLEATLPAGSYIVETVQHYNRDGRTRSFEISVEGDGLSGAPPQLVALTADGTVVAAFKSYEFSADMVRPAAVVTLAAQTAAVPPPYPQHSVLIEPADADLGTAGHQVELAEYGLTEVTVTVTAGDGVMSNRYVVTFSGDHEAAVSTGSSVLVGGSVRARVDSAGDRDWFAVDLVADSAYRIDLEGKSSASGSLVDPYVFGVRLGDGTMVAGTSDDDSGDGKNSALWFVASATGTHFVDVGADGSGTGTYELSVTGLADDFAASTATAGAVVVDGAAVGGGVDFRGDRDWFAVTLEAGRTYVLKLGGSPSGVGTLADPHLFGVHDDAGVLVAGASDADSGLGSEAESVFAPTVDGEYFVSASTGGNGTGTYELLVADVTGGFPDDFAGDASTAGAVAADGSVQGAVEFEGDRDWFAVSVEAVGVYSLRLRGSDSGGGTLLDPVLYGVFDDSGVLVAGTSDDDSGQGPDSVVRFWPEADGTLYVSVGTVAGERGTYTLEVELQRDDYRGDVGTSGRLSVGVSKLARVDFLGDQDWFAVDLVAGVGYRFFEQSRVSSYEHGIFDEDGVEVSGAHREPDTEMYWVPETSGTYYVAIVSRELGLVPAVGPYRVSVERLADDYPAGVSTTGSVVVGGKATGKVQFPFDPDWFAVELEAGTPYLVQAKGWRSGNGTLWNPNVPGIYDDQGVLLPGTSVDGGGVGNFESWQVFTPSAAGTYYVSVSQDSWPWFWDDGPWVGGTYKLSVDDVTDGIADDCGQDAASACDLRVPGSKRGDFEVDGDSDWFAVDLVAGTSYRFLQWGVSIGFGPVTGVTLYNPKILGIYDDNGIKLPDTTADSDGNGNLTALVDFAPLASGTYYVKAGANTRHSNGVGTYWVSVSETDSGPEPFDDYPADDSTLGSLGAGGAATGKIETRNDKDWFAAYLVADAVYTITLEGRGRDPLDDVRVGGVYDFDGNWLSADAHYTGTVDADSAMTFTATESGLHFIEAAGHVDANGWSTGSYRMTLDIDLEAGTALTLGESAAGEITVADTESHLYSVELEAGVDYWVQADPGSLDHPYLVRVYDQDGVAVYDHSGEPTELAARIRRITASKDGIYFVVVAATSSLTDPGDGIGTYRITVSDMSDTALTAVAGQAGVSALTVGVLQRSSIDAYQETDRYRVYLEAGTEYRIDMEGDWTGYSDANGDWVATATLYNPIIEAVYHEDDTTADLIVGSGHHDAGIGQNSQVAFTPAADGFYLIDAGAEHAWTGTYVLTVAEANGWSAGTSRMTQAAQAQAATALAVTALAVGVSAAGEITVAGTESHVYAVELEAGKHYWVQADPGTLEHPYLLRVYDADGVAVHDHSGEPSELGARLRRITASKDGTYFIVVAATTSLTDPGDDGIGTYRDHGVGPVRHGADGGGGPGRRVGADSWRVAAQQHRFQPGDRSLSGVSRRRASSTGSTWRARGRAIATPTAAGS